MSEDRMHVVFGTGQVGRALTARLAKLGLAVRAVSRHRPPALADGVDWRAADASDPEAATATREVLALVSGEVGHTVAIRSVPKLVVRALGVFIR
jgi:uncharacterized protein YbjT (DUF2867 family)